MGEQIHTPGPWAWNKNGNSLLLWGTHGSRPIVLNIGHVRGVASGKTILRMRDAAKDLMIEATSEHPDAKLIADAPAMQLILDLVSAGLARFEGSEFCFNGLRFRNYEYHDWTHLVNILGWAKCRNALLGVAI